jgi:hypothetical protein
MHASYLFNKNALVSGKERARTCAMSQGGEVALLPQRHLSSPGNLVQALHVSERVSTRMSVHRTSAEVLPLLTLGLAIF